MNNHENSRDAADMLFAIREWLHQLVSWRHLMILSAVILLFAWIAPFGTYLRLSGLERVLYWALAIGLNWVFGVLATPLAVTLMRAVNWPHWVGIVVGALVAALPGTGVVLLLEAWLDEPLEMATELAFVYASVALIHMVIGYVGTELVRRQIGNANTPPPGASPTLGPQHPSRSIAGAASAGISPTLAQQHPSRQSIAGAASPRVSATAARFLARLPPRLGNRLLHLRMRDHYVEAHTELGSELVLMRFSDALKELDGLEGMRVHRSHWVATDAVSRVVHEGGRTFLELQNGERVPVSRPYRSAIGHL